MNKINVSAYEQNEYNFRTLFHTQPQGNIEQYATYSKVPGGYAQVLYVTDMQSTQNKNHYLANIAAEDNTIMVVSAGVEEPKTFVDRLEKSHRTYLAKNKGRGRRERLMDNFDNEGDAFALLARNMSGDNRQNAMRVYIRLIVFERTKQALKQRVKDIMARYDAFQFVTLRDFQFEEMRSMWIPAMQQIDALDENLLGLSMSSADLGGAFWADHVKLQDPEGTYLGTTFTNGLVNFNPYLRDSGYRSRPFLLFLGSPGFGKSTLQKMLLEDSVMRGNRTVYFDPADEYDGITEYLDGVSVSLDGSDGMINPMQPYPTVTLDKNGDEIDVQGSFSQHLEKIASMYGFLSEGLTQEQLSNDRLALTNLLTRFYIFKHMWDDNPLKFPEKIHLFDLKNNQYPTISEFVVWLRQQRRGQGGQYSEQFFIADDSFNRIIATFENMAKQNGTKFDGYTTLPDLSGEDVVRYDVGSLMGTPSVFNAQIYSALAREQANIIKNGKRQRALRQQGLIDMLDVKHTMLILDEAQNYITLENAFNLNFLVKLMEQMRKNYAALMMAMPTLKDLVVEDTATPDPTAKAFYRDVKKLFDLMQYRFFFNVTQADAKSLSNVMGDSITPAELYQLPKLHKFEALLNIQGDRNLLINVRPTRSQVDRFHGGD